MAPRKRNTQTRPYQWVKGASAMLMAFAVAIALSISPAHAQSAGTQNPPTSQPPARDIPDAPSTVQPPPEPQPKFPDSVPVGTNPAASDQPGSSTSSQPPEAEKSAPEPIAPTGPAPSTGPRNQLNPKEDLYKISVSTSFVQIPVMVKDADGRRVDGLLPKDFAVTENGKPQTLSYFTSDPFELSVAILLDIGMADVGVQKVNQTYSALAGAFSPYDEVALYTYSSTVSQVTDFSGRPERLTAALNELKMVRGHANGPPVLGGPLGPGGPTINGAPPGGPVIAPVNTPPRESHVLNDAILRAALDLGKRDRTRRKIILVISDGRELGSQASYSDVLKVLETRNIQVKAVVIDAGALPLFRQVGKIHLKGQGYFDLLPKYVGATGGGQPLAEMSRNAMEEAYSTITNEARNQYTLGYVPKATTGGSAYRSVEVVVYKKGLKVLAKDGYYPTPAAR